MNSADFKASMDRYILDKFKMLNTIKPGVVTQVKGQTVDVRPLTTTLYTDGVQLQCPQLFEVPLLQLRTKHATIELPVSVGDPVIVLFSDRDYGDLLDQPLKGPTPSFAEDPQPLGLFPIMAIPMGFSQASNRSNPGNIRISCKGTTLEVGDFGVKVNGDIECENLITPEVDLNAFYQAYLVHFHTTAGVNSTPPVAP